MRASRSCVLLASGLLLACRDVPPDPPRQARTFPSQDELVAEALARVDRDGDGRLGVEEYERVGNGRDLFVNVDRNGDRQIDVQELGRALRTINPGYRNRPASAKQR